jgi:predicted DNA-binding transcriptional regulator AlpA
MPRPRLVDVHVRNAVSKALHAYFSANEQASKRIKKTAFAKGLGISRPALYTYLSGDATPSSEVLSKLVAVPGISIEGFRGPLTPDDFPRPSAPTRSIPMQQSLPFETPVILENEDLRIGVERKPAGVLEVTVKLKLA